MPRRQSTTGNNNTNRTRVDIQSFTIIFPFLEEVETHSAAAFRDTKSEGSKSTATNFSIVPKARQQLTTSTALLTYAICLREAFSSVWR
jgi:hypothetical protein